jgi:hypothetical protein
VFPAGGQVASRVAARQLLLASRLPDQAARKQTFDAIR